MTDSIYIVDQCIHRGLQYLEEPLQFYWPAKIDPSGRFNPVAENNIALHLARSFTEAGFAVWAEVPSNKNNDRLDFLAYCGKEKVSVALELKRSIDMPPEGSNKDLVKLAGLRGDNGVGLANAGDAINGAKWIYGIVTMFYATEFVNWWKNPEDYDYGRKSKYLRSDTYKQIGRKIAKAHRKIMPITKWENVNAAYALYDENLIGELKKMILENA